MMVNTLYHLKKDEIFDVLFSHANKTEYAFDLRVVKVGRPQHHIFVWMKNIHKPCEFEIEIEKTDNGYVARLNCESDGKYYETKELREYYDVSELLDELFDQEV